MLIDLNKPLIRINTDFSFFMNNQNYKEIL